MPLYDTEATHCLYHGNYPCSVHFSVYGRCLYVQARKLCPGTALGSSMVHPWTISQVSLYEWVHICTLSYTTGYIYVVCLYEYCRYIYVLTRSTFGELDPFCHTIITDLDLGSDSIWYSNYFSNHSINNKSQTNIVQYH